MCIDTKQKLLGVSGLKFLRPSEQALEVILSNTKPEPNPLTGLRAFRGLVNACQATPGIVLEAREDHTEWRKAGSVIPRV